MARGVPNNGDSVVWGRFRDKKGEHGRCRSCYASCMSDDEKYEIVFPLPLAVREVWPSEPANFTPWLSKHLEVLDILGLGELKCEGTEVPIPQTGRA